MLGDIADGNVQCTVVVCTRGRPGLLQRCLSSLRDLDHPSYEVLVVDNTSGDAAVEAVAKGAGARYLVVAKRGLSHARNVGGAEALGELVAMIDDDAIADPDWLTRHVEALADSPAVAATGRLFPLVNGTTPPGGSEALNEAFLALGSEDLGGERILTTRESPWWYERVNFLGLAMGSNLVFSRSLFDDGPIFDESLGLGTAIPGGEEHHALFKLLERGETVIYVPDAIVRHDVPATPAAVRRRRRRILRGTAAYIVKLMAEEPRFRERTRGFVLARIGLRPEPWRPRAAGPGATRFEGIRAMTEGTTLYAITRLRRTGRYSSA